MLAVALLSRELTRAVGELSSPVGIDGRGAQIRTEGLVLPKHARYLLRHAPMMVGEEGDDPPTSRPPAVRSAC